MRNYVLQIRITQEDRIKFEKLAKEDGHSLSTWCYKKLRKWIDGCEVRGSYFRSKVTRENHVDLIPMLEVGPAMMRFENGEWVPIPLLRDQNDIPTITIEEPIDGKKTFKTTAELMEDILRWERAKLDGIGSPRTC